MKVTLLCSCENYNEHIIKNNLIVGDDSGRDSVIDSGRDSGRDSGEYRDETTCGVHKKLICNPYLSSKGIHDAQCLSHSKIFDLVICSPLNASKKTFAVSDIKHSGFHRIFISFLCRETMINMGDFFEHEFTYKQPEIQMNINKRIYDFVDYLYQRVDYHGLSRKHVNILIVTHRNFIYHFTTLFSKSYHCSPGEFVICDV